jgi:excisionase family DNA binding protein
MQKITFFLEWVKRELYELRGLDPPRDEKEELMSEKPERVRTRPYSVEEAAEKAGIDDKTLRKAIDDGTVVAIRMGRRVLIPCAPFDRLIEQGQ